jgi:hypothetical protein
MPVAASPLLLPVCFAIIPSTSATLKDISLHHSPVFFEGIHGVYPFGQGGAFCLNMGAVPAFCFYDKGFTVVQFYEEIRIVIMGNPFKSIENAKTKAVIFGKGRYTGIFSIR